MDIQTKIRVLCVASESKKAPYNGAFFYSVYLCVQMGCMAARSFLMALPSTCLTRSADMP